MDRLIYELYALLNRARNKVEKREYKLPDTLGPRKFGFSFEPGVIKVLEFSDPESTDGVEIDWDKVPEAVARSLGLKIAEEVHSSISDLKFTIKEKEAEIEKLKPLAENARKIKEGLQGLKNLAQ